MRGALFFWQNFAQATATAITATGSQSQFPLSWVRLQAPWKKWRSPTGWTIVAGFNDKIDFNRSGVKVATITPGIYSTPAALCTAIVAALEAVDATPVWAASYSGTTFKFTISSDIAFTLLGATGANLTAQVLRDLGFPAVDTGSSTSQTATVVSYQSRHALSFDLTTIVEVMGVFVLGHPFGTLGTIRVDGSSSPLTAAGAVGGYSVTLAAVASCRGQEVSPSQSYRYWRILLDGVELSIGYTEVAVPFIGPSLELSRRASIMAGVTRGYRDFSSILRSDHGRAVSQVRRDRPRVWRVGFTALSNALRISIETAFETIQKGVPMFWIPDPEFTPTEFAYIFYDQEITAELTPGSTSLWDVSLTLEEAK